MAMDVDATALGRLLELQAEDTAIQRLTDRRAALPEAARLAEVNAQLAELEADLEIARKQQEEIAREISRLEGETELVDQKIEREEQRMFSGAVANPRELSALQAEVEMLKRKKAGLEDEELEAMVTRDQADSTVATLTSERDQASKESQELTVQVAGLTQDIEAQLKQHEATRKELVATIPEQVLTLYEKLRVQKAGIGAAALEGGTCQGCHTKLPAKEVERLRAEGGLQRCDNCRRILVIV